MARYCRQNSLGHEFPLSIAMDLFASRPARPEPHWPTRRPARRSRGWLRSSAGRRCSGGIPGARIVGLRHRRRSRLCLPESADLMPLLLEGAPPHLGSLYNCAIAIHRGVILGVVPKIHAGGGRAVASLRGRSLPCQPAFSRSSRTRVVCRRRAARPSRASRPAARTAGRPERAARRCSSSAGRSGGKEDLPRGC
jgi:hypothetical protein